MIKPTNEQLSTLFTKTTGGPNPYFTCSKCGRDWPGIESELIDHYNDCIAITEFVEVHFIHDMTDGWYVAIFPPKHEVLNGEHSRSITIERDAAVFGYGIKFVGDPQHNPWKVPND